MSRARSGWQPPRGASPLVLTEADSHIGLANRMLAPLRAARVPRVPDRRRRGERYPGDGPPGAARGARGRPRPARGSLSPCRPGPHACSCSGGVSARGRLNFAAVEALRDVGGSVPAHHGTPRLRRAARAPRRASRGYRLIEYDAESLCRSPRGVDLVVARAGGSTSRSRPPGARRSSFRIRTRRPTIRPHAAGWRTPALPR